MGNNGLPLERMMDGGHKLAKEQRRRGRGQFLSSKDGFIAFRRLACWDFKDFTSTK
jgi:hypothetical protein